jgi:hypothetical protein
MTVCANGCDVRIIDLRISLGFRKALDFHKRTGRSP